MTTYLYVGIGGALGAMLRYGLSTITVKMDFPVMTFITNLVGAVLIGFIVGIAANRNISENLMLLLKTGFCGGFTTFSTFSLETLNRLEQKDYAVGAAYAVLSLVCCVIGVWIGRRLVEVTA